MDTYNIYIEIANEIDGIVISQMFGKPCLKINSKPFVSFFENEMIFKLNLDRVNELLNINGSHLFDPSKKGRPMKQWIQIPFISKENWKELALESLNYVKEII